MTNRLVVGLGEALWDVLPQGKKLGGAPANFAFHASQLGLDTIAVSALGNDALALETIDALDAKGLNYLMPRVDFPTGTVQVELDDNGVPSYDIKTGVAWDNIPLTQQMRDVASNARAVCWGSLAQRSEVSRGTIRDFIRLTPADCLRVFDINLRQHFYDKQTLTESFKLCNVLKINDEELDEVGRMFGYPDLGFENKCWLILGKYNLHMLVLTCGVNGSYVFTPGSMSFQPTPKVNVADTVGAGDSFTGAFVASILHGMPVPQAHERAVRVSAYVCTQPGAMPSLPPEVKKI